MLKQKVQRPAVAEKADCTAFVNTSHAQQLQSYPQY